MLISKTPQIVDEIEGPIPTTIDKKAINERFEKAVELLLSEKLAVSKADIAQGLGIKPSAFTEILSGRNQVSADKILMLCERFPVNSEFIFYGKGAILRSGINEIDFAEMAVPFFESEVIGGVGNHTFSMDKKDISTYYVVPDFKIRGCDMIIGLTGDSMSPKYNNGDKIACKILHEKKVVEYGKVFVVGTREHGLILKRVRKSTNPNNYLMVSDNPDYDAFEVEKEDVTGLALVLGILRID